MSDYLWDKTGEPEADVEQLENLLGALKYQPRPLEIPAGAMPAAPADTTTAAHTRTLFFSRPRLAIAASLLLTLLAGMWFITRQSEPQRNQLAEVEGGSPAVEGVKPEQAAVTEDKSDGDDADEAPVKHNGRDKQAVAPRPRENRTGIVASSSSAPKVQRAPQRRLVAGGRKLQPRVRDGADAPARRELIATHGAMRWEAEQPLTPQQREATEKLMLALSVASAKFNYAQREMQEIGRAEK